MPLSALPVTDTRFLFRDVSSALVPLLRSLPEGDWERPTVAGAWRVRDVLAHLVDVTLRRLSFHRDGLTPPVPAQPIESERAFVAYINGLNAAWVDVAHRFSPRVLTDVFDRASADLADFFEALPLDAPACFPVSWAGEEVSAGWFDVGRDFTELWHHQEQIRMAVGAAPLADARYLRAVLEIAVRGLPHAYRDVAAAPGESMVLDVTGPSGGTWSLVRGAAGWDLAAGQADTMTARVRVADADAWKLLFNALAPPAAAAAAQVVGTSALAAPLFGARSVVV